MSVPFRIAIAGLGTVGRGVTKILQDHEATIAGRVGRPVQIVAVNARNRNADRGVDVSAYDWVDDALSLAGRDDVDAIVEVIGGSDGIAKNLAEKTLQNKKHFVTANKALLAHHGQALAELAEQNGVSIGYEASVAGGIPIIKALREGLAANEVTSVLGILNGTCNYILTEMRETGRDFTDVLLDAQEKGYAEADPTFDVGGIDAGHKLALLTALAFGVKPDFAAMEIEGIDSITAADIKCATELGYRIKLLGTAKRMEGSKILQMVSPCMVPIKSSIGAVEGVFNAVFTEAYPVDTSLFVGRGAGEGPTASSVVADILDLARGIQAPTFGVAAQDLKTAQWADPKELSGKYYLHLQVKDEPGVIADVAAILRDNKISIESQIQREHAPGTPASVVIVTHQTSGRDVHQAAAAIQALPSTVDTPTVLRIEQI